jgi:2,3,4,5-tetrahydropyridine-2,6-dicarboxylate N-succinyltransferase
MATFAENLAQVKEPNFVIPTAFAVGNHENSEGENLGSLALLAQASGAGLSISQVLPLFAEHWEAVQANPTGTDHGNIRALWSISDQSAQVADVVKFEKSPLVSRQLIDEMWENRSDVTPQSNGSMIFRLIQGLDSGHLRVSARDDDGKWSTDQTLKKAVLLSFRLLGNQPNADGYEDNLHLRFYDKVPTKFADWSDEQFAKAGIRVVPPAVARRGSFIGHGVILMPSFVNIGAYVGEGTMVDTWATVGSCAQIGKNVHLSGGVGIGGVLEPLQANPTIIEDGCFIGARSEVVEGVIIRRRAVLSMGTFIGKNTPIVDRTKGGLITRGEIPENAVVMMGVHPRNGLICPQIVKYRDEQTDVATALNEILR